MKEKVSEYAQKQSSQIRKGFLPFCVLKICSKEPVYTSDIIKRLRDAQMVVAEGTIYPLLSRLQKEGLLEYFWKESEQGPPRKYFKITELGKEAERIIWEKTQEIEEILEKIS